MLTFHVLTIFPELFDSFLKSSLINKAIERNLLRVNLTNIRDYAEAPHYQVDDSPYGGGAGMVMKPEPLAKAIEAAKDKLPNAKIILLTPQGEKYSQFIAAQYSKEDSMILICGRYEGVDQRVIDLYVDEEVSIGDYVLMGGELPAMVVIEATARLAENVIGNSESLHTESFQEGAPGEILLEAPHYTRPAEFRGKTVPNVLLSGNHKEIAAWRLDEARMRTKMRRPDLLAQSQS